jgi:hypothetical protein
VGAVSLIGFCGGCRVNGSGGITSLASGEFWFELRAALLQGLKPLFGATSCRG